MAIFTAVFLILVLVVPAAIYEGCVTLYYKVQDAREWRRIKRIYFNG